MLKKLLTIAYVALVLAAGAALVYGHFIDDATWRAAPHY